MDKSKTGTGRVGQLGTMRALFAVSQDFGAKMLKRNRELEAENKELMGDLEHANKCWQVCAGQLRQARKKNYQLWLQLDGHS